MTGNTWTTKMFSKKRKEVHLQKYKFFLKSIFSFRVAFEMNVIAVTEVLKLTRKIKHLDVSNEVLVFFKLNKSYVYVTPYMYQIVFYLVFLKSGLSS